jgi:hypothetical protein
MENHPMDEAQFYTLHIDGPLFRRQRELLLRIQEAVHRKRQFIPQADDDDLLEGLLGTTDAIADQAHDRHGIDCLLNNEDGGRC